jgi:microcystin degradation protein MlrC
MRVGIIGLQHESNTFSPIATRLDSFEIAEGEAVIQAWEGSHHEVWGFLRGLQQEALEPVPMVVASATPAGTIADAAFDAILSAMERWVHRGRPVDGLLVAAHGAAVTETRRDADGYWLGLLREWVGPEVPVICTVDAHANVSQAMVDACQAIIAYRSNPHLDMFDRGIEAAQLMARILKGEVQPVQAATSPPFVINILLQETAAPPCLPLYALADSMRGKQGILAVSICLGFPYADVEEMGTSFVVVTDGRPDLARSLAGELADFAGKHRVDFVPEFVEPEEAVEKAAMAKGPVCLLDTGDNVGGGSAGDGTTLAHLVQERGARTFVCIYEPEGVARALEAGVGARVRLTIGGKTDDLHGPPLEAEVTVQSQHDGRFTEAAVRHGGRTVYDMGETVLVSTDAGLTIQLTSKRIVPFSLNQLLSCGVDPREFQILVAKGVHAPVPAYAPVCPTIIRATTPGSTTPDLTRLKFRHRRRPLFPFEEIEEGPRRE